MGIVLLVSSLSFLGGFVLGWLFRLMWGRKKARLESEKLKARLAEQQKAMSRHEQSVQGYEKQILQLRTDRDSLELRLKDAEKQYAKDTEAHKEQRSKLEQELLTYRQQQKHLENRLSLMVGKSAYNTLKLQLSKSEKKLSQQQEELNRLQEQEQHWKESYERLLSDSQKATTPEQQQYQELEAAYERLEEEYQEQEKLLQQWEKASDDWVRRNELETLQKDHERLQRQLQEVNKDGDVTVPISELYELQEELEALRKRQEQQALLLARYQAGLNLVPATNPERRDDLKQISGIGKVIEQKLNEIGIYTFEQISRFTEEDIEKVTQVISFFPGRILRDDWVGQAEKLMAATSESD